MRAHASIRRLITAALLSAVLIPVHAQQPKLSREQLAKRVDVGPTGIEIKRPVFAGACKACPWGILAKVTADALRYYGYQTTICWVCWSSFGPREMGDKTKPVTPPGALDNPEYVEPPPDAVPFRAAT